MGNISTLEDLDLEERKRLLEKLAKLKALSECQTGNVNETATAAATMTRIMLEYQIEMADLEDGEEDDLDVLDEPVLAESYNGFPMWKKSLLSALAEVNHCMSYSRHATEYFFWERRTRSSLSLIGASRDIENTRKLFTFCVDEIERLCKAWGRGQPVKRKNDFKKGAASGIADKVRKERDKVLAEERERAHASHHRSPALTLFDRKEDAVDVYAESIGICYVRRRSRGVYQDAYSAGYTVGASMDLSRAGRLGLPAAR